MATFHLSCLAAVGCPLRHRRKQNAAKDHSSAIAATSDSVVRARVAFTGRRSGFAAARTWRTTVLGAYDAARGSDADLRPIARTRSTPDCIFVGRPHQLARRGCHNWALTILQAPLELCFGPALSLASVRIGSVDVAYPILLRSDTAQRLDSRRATYDFS